MTVIDTTARRSGGEGKDFVILPSDVYRMKIVKSAIEENRFADVLPDGTRPMQLVLTWEVTALTEEQQEAADEAGEEWVGAAVWQRINPYYGPVRDGGVSRFQAFVDMLREQGYDINPEAFDPESLVGIEQRVNVEKYTKSMGENAGRPGNKVVSVMPIRRKGGDKAAGRNVPRRLAEDEELF